MIDSLWFFVAFIGLAFVYAYFGYREGSYSSVLGKTDGGWKNRRDKVFYRHEERHRQQDAKGWILLQTILYESAMMIIFLYSLVSSDWGLFLISGIPLVVYMLLEADASFYSHAK